MNLGDAGRKAIKGHVSITTSTLSTKPANTRLPNSRSAMTPGCCTATPSNLAKRR